MVINNKAKLGSFLRKFLIRRSSNIILVVKCFNKVEKYVRNDFKDNTMGNLPVVSKI
jgi:hypothetical protein